MSDNPPEVIPICRNVWNTMRVCEGDEVEVYVRGLKSMVGVTGRVKKISDAGIVVENEDCETAIRFSEIRQIRRRKNKGERK